MKTTQILLVDDHALVRSGLKLLLQSIENITVVGEAGDGTEALAQCEALSPDLVLMDLSMRGDSGLKVTAEVLARYPKIRVLILTMHATDDFARQALRAGASGYVLKDATADDLQTAIQAALNNRIYLSPQISPQVLETIERHLPTSEKSTDGLQALAERQREVMTLLAQGLSTKEVAFQLKVSPKTIETHRSHIMERLHLRDIPSLVRLAIKFGLVKLDP